MTISRQSAAHSEPLSGDEPSLRFTGMNGVTFESGDCKFRRSLMSPVPQNLPQQPAHATLDV
jgi:hypothetical protein